MAIIGLKLLLKNSHQNNTFTSLTEGNSSQCTSEKVLNLLGQSKICLHTRRKALANLKSRKSTNFQSFSQHIIKSIDFFYNDDAVSTILAGNKEFITRNKNNKQKWYLTAPLKVLHNFFFVRN